MQALEPLREDLITSLRDLVVRQIRTAILDGRLRPGEKLIQEDLARHLGVSRQPVREALRRLEAEGLVVHQPRRGVYVRAYSEADIREIYMLRRLLEVPATEMAASRLDAQGVAELVAINEQMARAAARGDGERFVQLNNAFHDAIHRASGSPRLVELIRRLWIGDTVYGPMLIPGRASRSVEEHRGIVAALERRDGAAAARAMLEHLHHAEAEYFRFRGASLPAPEDGAAAAREAGAH